MTSTPDAVSRKHPRDETEPDEAPAAKRAKTGWRLIILRHEDSGTDMYRVPCDAKSDLFIKVLRALMGGTSADQETEETSDSFYSETLKEWEAKGYKLLDEKLHDIADTDQVGLFATWR